MMPSLIRFSRKYVRNSLEVSSFCASRGSLNRNSNGIAPMMAIHKIHVRGGTRNSPVFFVSLLSSAMGVEKCAGNYHPSLSAATCVYKSEVREDKSPTATRECGA